MTKARAVPLGLFSSSKGVEGAAETPADDRSVEVMLLRRAKAGDPDAFGALVERYWKRAYWTAYDVLYDHDRAQDVAQEAFVKVHRALQTFDLGRDFASWLYRIALNLAIDHKRRRARDKSVSTDKIEEMVDARRALVEDEERAGMIERVETVLSGMTDKYRIPLTLKDVEGLSVEEIAKVLDLSYSTVRWRLHKARTMFRERWQRLLRREEREHLR